MGGRLNGLVYCFMAKLALFPVRNRFFLMVAANAAFHPHEVNRGQSPGLSYFTMAFPTTDFRLGMNVMRRRSIPIIWPFAGLDQDNLPIFAEMTEQALLTPRLSLINGMTLHACLMRGPGYFAIIHHIVARSALRNMFSMTLMAKDKSRFISELSAQYFHAPIQEWSKADCCDYQNQYMKMGTFHSLFHCSGSRRISLLGRS